MFCESCVNKDKCRIENPDEEKGINGEIIKRLREGQSLLQIREELKLTASIVKAFMKSRKSNCGYYKSIHQKDEK